MPLKLLKGIRHFKENQFLEKKELFSALSKGQWPESIFITCSDSRIDPKYFTNAELGDMFILRNAGNIITPMSNIPSADAATLEYGVSALNIPHIVVCGHSGCGAMKGVMDPQLKENLPHTATWLCQCQPLLKQIKKELPATEQLIQLIQANILEQIERLKSYPFINERIQNNTLTLHAWYYEFNVGEVYIYDFANKKFISSEQKIAETAKEQFELIVQKQAKNYLERTTMQQDHDNEICTSTVWSDIETSVTQQAEKELNDLITANQLSELLKQGPSILLQAKYLSSTPSVQDASMFRASKRKREDNTPPDTPSLNTSFT